MLGNPPDLRRRAAGLLCLLSLGACALFEPNDPRLSVEVAADVDYAPGATIPAMLRNRSGSDWYYAGPCNPAFERRDGDAWVPAHEAVCGLFSVDPASSPDRLSYAPLLVAAGDERRVTFRVPEEAASGTHRIRVSFVSRSDGGGRSTTRFSSPFEVRSPSLAVR